ncbi:MAG: DUF4292 domain-containing protein [Bacteroidota bacterium]
MIQQYWGLALLLVVFIGFGCKTPKVVTDDKPATAESTAEAYLKDFAMNQVQADWMTATARVNLASDALTIGGTANIRMQKDERIWMTVKKFGFEAGRAMVTKDSIYILDRLNSAYSVEPLSYVEERFRLPADLTMLQQLLLGNPVFLTTANAKAMTTDGRLRWQASNEDSTNEFAFELPNYQLQTMAIEQEREGRSLNIQLDDYRPAGTNRDFSYLRTINVTSQQTGPATIEFQFSKVEVNQPTTFPFQVPDRYSRD